MVHSKMRTQWYPLSNNRFIVCIGNKEIGFSKISGVELMDPSVVSKNLLRIGKKDIKTELVSLYEGDEDDSQSDGSSDSGQNTITLEKALKPKLTDSDQVYLLHLAENNVLIDCISVRILRNDGSLAASLNFSNCVLTSLKLSELAADSNSYINQTLTFQYCKVKLIIE